MPGPAFLRGDEVTLRTVEPEDYGFVHRHWNERDIRQMTNRHAPRTEADVREFVERADESVVLLVCREATPVGLVWLFDVDPVDGRAEVGYWVAADERGQGYASAALGLVVDYGFDERRFHRLMARVFDGNEASIAVLERQGFEREGRLRDHHFVDGEYVDTHLFGLLESDR